MDIKKIDLNVNQKLELKVDTGPYQGTYLSKVADITNNSLKVVTPYKEGSLVPLRVGLKLDVFFNGKYAAYKFQSQIMARQNENIAVLVLAFPPTKVSRIQRREYFRLELRKKLKYRILDDNFEPTTQLKETYTVDLSGGGLKMVISEEIPLASILDIYLPIIELGDIPIRAKVLKINQENDYQTVSLEFIDIDEKTRDIIISYLFDYQRKLRQRGLL